tara:strand:- start:481 stop:1119 length:639 start_codon:yes stop_codon:yes gene_type:complete
MTIDVQPAVVSDLTYIDSLQKKNAEELAFYPSQVFEREIENQRILLARVNNDPAGYIYHGAFGDTLKIHQACIQYDLRGQLYGAELVKFLTDMATRMLSNAISLRCGSDIEANGFWRSMGFACERVTQGGIRRRRDINHWFLQLQPTLFPMIITEPSNKKKDSSVWAKGRKLGFTQNSFLRGDSTIEYREAIEQAVGKDKKNKVLPYPKNLK